MPIIPINFNSLPNDCVLVEVTDAVAIGALLPTTESTSSKLLNVIDSFEIIEFLNLSLDLNLFFFEFFFANLSSILKLVYY